MTNLICHKNVNLLEGMDYKLSRRARIFLDKINSSLVCAYEKNVIDMKAYYQITTIEWIMLTVKRVDIS